MDIMPVCIILSAFGLCIFLCISSLLICLLVSCCFNCNKTYYTSSKIDPKAHKDTILEMGHDLLKSDEG